MKYTIGALLLVLSLISAPAFSDVVYTNPYQGTGNKLYDWANTAFWVGEVLPGAGDDVYIVGPGNTNDKFVVKMSADREINSLTFASAIKFYLGAADNNANSNESPVRTLTINTGNITLAAGAALGQYSGIRSTIHIPAGANATWNLGDSVSPNNHPFGFAGITSGANVTITKAGTKNITISADNSAGLSAAWQISGGNLSLGAAGALGTGPVSYSGPNLTFTGSGSHANDWTFGGVTVSFNTNTGADGITTFSGNIAGTGTLDRSGNATGAGALILAGSNNTFTGNINHPRGLLALDGNFEGLGNIVMTTNSNAEVDILAGTGMVGMGLDKKITLAGVGSAGVVSKLANLSPGRVGTIGTLTIGTADNNNSIELNSYSGLTIDIDETGSDLLAITGALNLNTDAAFVQGLYLAGELGSMDYTFATFTVAKDWSVANAKFDKVYWNGVLVDSPELENAIGGSHKLVYGDNSISLVNAIPEPATTGLLVVGGVLALIRRRR